MAVFCFNIKVSEVSCRAVLAALSLRQLREAKQPSPSLLQRQMLHCVLRGQALLQKPLKSEGSGKRSAIVWLCSWYLLARQGERLGVPTQLRRAGMYSPSLISLQCVTMFCPFSGFGCCCSSLHWIPQSAVSDYISVWEPPNRICWRLGFAEDEGRFWEASSKRVSKCWEVKRL